MEHQFYHGTSSIYLRSIKKYGLGGINPNIDYKLFELLRFMYELSELHLLDCEDYLLIRNTTKAMVFQETLEIKDGKDKGIHNFRHKNIYLSYGEYRAVTYATSTEYGSEILTRIIDLYRLLKNKVGQITIPSSINVINISMVESRQYFPILIGIDFINPQYLRTESGEPAEESLLEILIMKNLLDYKTFGEWIQLHNFELLRPISQSELTFYKICYTGCARNHNLNWTNVRI